MMVMMMFIIIIIIILINKIVKMTSLTKRYGNLSFDTPKLH